MGSLFGYEVSADVPLARLSRSAGRRGRIRVERATEATLDLRGEITAVHGWDDGSSAGFALATVPSGLLAWCSVSGPFHIDASARRIVAAPTSCDEAWEQRLVATAAPLLVAERGDLALHASAVATGDGAVIWCGPTTRGKSTLALLCARLGFSVLAEDGAVLELGGRARPLVWPGARGARVSAEALAAAGERPPSDAHAASNGRHVVPVLEAAGPCPVAAVVVLAPRGQDVAIQRLAPAAAVAALTPSLIHRGGPEGLRPAIALLARLVEAAPVYRASMPDDLERGPAAATSLLEAVAA